MKDSFLITSIWLIQLNLVQLNLLVMEKALYLPLTKSSSTVLDVNKA